VFLGEEAISSSLKREIKIKLKPVGRLKKGYAMLLTCTVEAL